MAQNAREACEHVFAAIELWFWLSATLAAYLLFSCDADTNRQKQHSERAQVELKIAQKEQENSKEKRQSPFKRTIVSLFGFAAFLFFSLYSLSALIKQCAHHFLAPFALCFFSLKHAAKR